MNYFAMLTLIYTYLFIINTAAFFLYYADKMRACQGKRRISNFVLLAVAMLGGSYGAVMGMILFRHKTQSKSYLITVPLALLLWLAVVIVLRIY